MVASPFPCYRTTVEPCGILTRFSPSWIRFGTLEYFHLRGDNVTVKALMDWLIEEHFPELVTLEFKEKLISKNLLPSELFEKDQQNMEGSIMTGNEELEETIKKNGIGPPVQVPLNRYALLLRRIIERTAHLVAHWQANGFVHGNLNTENFSILGITIGSENGGFMDSYDPQWTPNKNGLFNHF